MAEEAWPETSWHLLRLLAREGSEAEWNLAWERFVRQYSPGLVAWCRTWGLSQHADEICQNVFFRIYPALRDFEFRRWFGWLLRAAAAELLAAPPDVDDPFAVILQNYRE
jgi:DNA-directed RNA polymerase specialized sigma24 family protein